MAALALLLSFLAAGASAVPLRVASKQPTRRPTGLAFRGGDSHVGGACGFQKTFPLNGTTYVAGASSRFFNKANVCGLCYELSCVNGKGACKKDEKVVVTIANECSGGRGNNGSPCRHGAFDMQPQAFDKIAKNKGAVISVAYKEVPCIYTGGVQFLVLNGDAYFLQVLIQNVAGPGALKGVAVQVSGSTAWKAMTNNYGSVWDLNNYNIKNRYLSFLLVGYNGQKLLLKNVLPPGFKSQRVYRATRNF